MTLPMTQTATPPRRLGRSVGAVVLGIVAVAVLSLVTDQLFHVLAVYPPWGQPIWYPIALVLTSFPLIWRGGVLHGKSQA